MHLELRMEYKEYKEDCLQVGENKIGIGLQIS